MAGEFHDLSEQLLNRESGGATAWGNLGYWADAAHYQDACTALADQVAGRLRLSPTTRLIDVGFGCGDQLLHWHARYGVRDMTGLNLSHSQTAAARRRLGDAGLHDVAGRLHRGSATGLASSAYPFARDGADAIVALDCAYHFASRTRFLQQAAAVLSRGGRLGVTDLVLGDSAISLRERTALSAIARLSHIPRTNLVNAATYQRQWQAAGFTIECFADISDEVMPGFGHWLRGYRRRYGSGTSRRHWWKYEATAAFLRWAWRGGRLRYVVCTGILDGSSART